MKIYKRCIMILADGSRPDLFEELSVAGLLPHCDEIFKKAGKFSAATSVFPSTTGPAYLPFLTGNYPGTCNVPGIRWFDKKIYGEGKPKLKRYRSYVGFESFLLNNDIEIDTPTLFQFFDHPVNIFSATNKGSTFKANKTKMSRIWYWYYAHLTDRWGMVDRAATKKILQVIDEGFDFAFAVYPAIDEYSHFSHPHTDKTKSAYLYLDKSLGEIKNKLIQKNQWDDTLIVLVSDHGLSKTEQHFGVAAFLEERGLKTFYYPKIFKWNFEAASMVSGNGMLHLYFQDKENLNGRKGWHGRTSFDKLEQHRGELLNDLLNHPGMDIMSGQNADGTIVALSKKGRAEIKVIDNKVHYKTIGSDPFGYGKLPDEMSVQESLERTFESEYPDALVQLHQIFRSSRTGDIAISATKGWDLRRRFEHPEHKGTHGGLIKEHMLIPFYTNAALPTRPCRSVDVFPTVLKLMGKEIPSNIDGISLI